MKAALILFGIIVFSMWIYLCIHYANTASTFIKNIFNKWKNGGGRNVE